MGRHPASNRDSHRWGLEYPGFGPGGAGKGRVMAGFVEATEEFVEASEWLGSEDAPAVATLRAVAEQLDGGDLTPALLGQYGLTYRSLLKRRPADPPDEDEFEQLLADGAR